MGLSLFFFEKNRRIFNTTIQQPQEVGEVGFCNPWSSSAYPQWYVRLASCISKSFKEHEWPCRLSLVVGWPVTQFGDSNTSQISQAFYAESDCWDHPILESWCFWHQCQHSDSQKNYFWIDKFSIEGPTWWQRMLISLFLRIGQPTLGGWEKSRS